MKSKSTAALLALFLGSIGIHRFYLNQSGRGILYLLFCWTLIPFLISLIDFIWLLTMNENTFNQKFNYHYQTPFQNHTNITVTNGTQNQPLVKTSASDEIKKLHDLKEQGILTQEEFELRKKKLLETL